MNSAMFPFGCYSAARDQFLGARTGPGAAINHSSPLPRPCRTTSAKHDITQSRAPIMCNGYCRLTLTGAGTQAQPQAVSRAVTSSSASSSTSVVEPKANVVDDDADESTLPAGLSLPVSVLPIPLLSPLRASSLRASPLAAPVPRLAWEVRTYEAVPNRRSGPTASARTSTVVPVLLSSRVNCLTLRRPETRRP